jgi:polyhydroxyalkanoate synthesis regulator phasin
MPRTDILQRYLEAGSAVTEMTRERAEAVVREFVKAGEVQRDNLQSRVDDLIERSRHNTEQLLNLIRSEIATQFSQLGLATKDDLAALEKRFNEQLAAATRAPAKAVAPAAKGNAATSATTTKAGGPAKAADPAKTAGPAKAADPAKTAGPAKKAPAKKAQAAAAPAPAAVAPAPAGSAGKKAAKKNTQAKKAAPRKQTASAGGGPRPPQG